MATVRNNAHPAGLWSRIRAAYEGRDRARQTPASIRVVDLARAFGVHENSIFGHAGAGDWARPGWYRLPGGIKRAPLSAPEQRAARLMQILRVAASQRAPCPTNGELATALGIGSRTARDMMRDAGQGEALRLEFNGQNRRRVVFADGAATLWTAPSLNGFAGTARPHAGRPTKAKPPLKSRRGIPDLCARDATRSLLRAGRQVFDCGVHDGDWGARWCVDGKIVDRAGLLAEARA